MVPPRIFVLPPDDDPFHDPCLTYAPNDFIVALPNPSSSLPLSLLNATLQCVLALPQLNESLPAVPSSPALASFVSLARVLQSEIVPPGMEWERGAPPPSPGILAPESTVDLSWWLALSGLDSTPSNVLVDAPSAPIVALFDHVLSKTRFASLFHSEVVPQPATFANPTPPPSPPSPFTPISISLAPFSESATTDIPALIARMLNVSPGFFHFGSSPPPPLSSSSLTPSKFSRLPTHLLIHLDRPQSATTPTTFHKTQVELPLELDLSFHSLPNAARKTFYRLHGFVTQTNGHFLTYTRLRASRTWFKCDDGSVERFDVGLRVASRGVVLVVYMREE
ncbi:hypothetical protein BJ742DRAFT_802934 [Cladochytrium replicatum]|nr:hypothetical protein BJ742DRAFT_802934 [Cladochytrium replicatum]